MASGTFPAEESSVIFLSIKESDSATNHVKKCLGEGKGKEEGNVSEWWCISGGCPKLSARGMAAAGSGWHKGQHILKTANWQKYSWFDKITEILLMHRLKHAATVRIVFPELSILVRVVGKFVDGEKHQQHAVGEWERFSKLYPAWAAASHTSMLSPVCLRAPQGWALGHSGQGACCWVGDEPDPPTPLPTNPHWGQLAF